MGDSLLRGVFLHAVSFLSTRSSNIEIVFNDSIPGDPHRSRYMCCSAQYLDSGSGDIGQCELHTLEQSLSPPLAHSVTADIIARRARGGIPICVSFTTSVYIDSFRETFSEFNAAFAATGIRPTSTVVNPGIWLLLPKFDLDRFAEQLKVLQAACAALFSKSGAPGGGSPPNPDSDGASPHTCILMTTADTAYTDEDAANHKHRRLHHNIQAYNTAMTATWLDGGMPVVDAGALSLHPAVVNSIDKDKLHYGVIGHRTESSPANPFASLCWQTILHTTAANGSHPCERGAAPHWHPASTGIATSSIRAPAPDPAAGNRRVRGAAYATWRAAAVWSRLMDLKRQRASGGRGGWEADSDGMPV